MALETAGSSSEGLQEQNSVTRRTPVGDEIYEILLSRVLSSELGANDRITIDALCRELGVSQTPIREALHRLSADGIVVRTHMAGYRVAPKITREQFEDLVEVRLLLEPVAVRRAAERAGPAELTRLREIADEMRDRLSDAGSGRGYANFSRLDTGFHDELAVVGGNGFIRESLLRLHTHVHMFRLASNPQITELAVEEHDEILSAVGLRDPESAAYAMRKHIEASARRFRRGYTDEA
jgi:DNA-binding GntR family transcriptional regulator